jgi:hypothetical protein
METIVKIARILLPLLTAAAGFAQDPPTTGTIKAGALEIIRTNSKFNAGPPIGTIETTQELFSGSFSSIDLSKLVPGGEQAPLTPIGTCYIVQLGLQQATPPTRTDAVTYLDAGPVINLTGPAGSKQIPLVKTGPGMTVLGYGLALGGGVALPFLPPPPPLFMAPGTYTADNGGGGADVGSFTATLEVPSLFVWTNADTALSIDRAAGQDFTWTGGDPNGKVYIGGSVALTDPVARRVTGGASFTCVADNSAGHFVVAPEVLTLLPASTTTAGVSNGNLVVSHGVEAKFDAPGVGESLLTFVSGVSRSAEFK